MARIQPPPDPVPSATGDNRNRKRSQVMRDGRNGLGWDESIQFTLADTQHAQLPAACGVLSPFATKLLNVVIWAIGKSLLDQTRNRCTFFFVVGVRVCVFWYASVARRF